MEGQTKAQGESGGVRRGWLTARPCLRAHRCVETLVRRDDAEPLANIVTSGVAEGRIPIMVFQREKCDDHRRLAFGLAHEGAKVLVCPACSSTDTAILRRRHRPEYWFSINAPRECAACKTVFVPQASALLRIVAFAFGVWLGGFSLVLYLIPAIVALASDGLAFRTLVNGVLGAVTVIFGVYVVVTAIRSGARRILPIDSGALDAE